MEVWGGVCYRHFVLALLLLTHLLNQLGRYMLAITIKPMAQELRFGDQSCQVNVTLEETSHAQAACDLKNITSCQEFTTDWNITNTCTWNYDGQGLPYQILAGPVFTVVYTISGILFGFAGDGLNRKTFLCCCMLFWSAATILTGFVKSYWQVVLLRFALGIGEAGCTPFATSLIADYFPKARRGLALGIYNLGIYMGYSLSFALGNFVTASNIMGQGWRWSFIVSGCPGVLLSFVMIFVVKEPRQKIEATPNKGTGQTNKEPGVSNQVKSSSSEPDLKDKAPSKKPTSGKAPGFKPETETTNLGISNRSYQQSCDSIQSLSEQEACYDKVQVTDVRGESFTKDSYQNGGEVIASSGNIQETPEDSKVVVFNDKARIVATNSSDLKEQGRQSVSEMRTKLKTLFLPYLNPSLSLLVLSGSLRNAAGYVWAYNTQPFFIAIDQTPTEISAYMSWIPMVGGSVGVVMGGFISDNFVKKRGPEARVLVVLFSQLLAVPFAVATLMVSPPQAYFFQIPSYIIGEMWVGVTLTVVIELVPPSARTAAVAVYLFISTNFGGTIPLLVPALQTAFLNGGFSKGESFRRTMYILYPGLIVWGAVFYILTLLVMKRDKVRNRSFSNVQVTVCPLPAETRDTHQSSE